MDAIILAGGKGTRIKSVLGDTPKCMADINGKPFLWYQINKLARFGVDHVIISVGFLKESIIEWAKSVENEFPLTIECVCEDTPLGTGGAIKKAMEKATSDIVIAMNGDAYVDSNLDDLVAFHRSHDFPLTITLKELEEFDRYGLVNIDFNGKITSFKEKQYCKRGFINGGLYCLSNPFKPFNDKGESFSFEKAVMEKESENGAVGGVITDGYFIDIGIPEDYERAKKELLKKIK